MALPRNVHSTMVDEGRSGNFGIGAKDVGDEQSMQKCG